jgi:hypothetical protein
VPRPDALFAEAPIQNVIEHLKNKLATEVADMTSDYILGVSDEKLCGYLEEAYRLELPVLREDRAEIVERKDIEVDVSWQHNRAFRPGTRPVVKGFRYVLAVPFDGDPGLFRFGTYFGNVAFGEVKKKERELLLSFEVEADRPDDGQVNDGLKRQMREVQEILTRIKPEVDNWNQQLPQLVRENAARARARAEKGRKIESSLSFPLRKKDSPSQPVPVSRKPLAIRPPATAPVKPEPRLEMTEYDEILTMLGNMAASMERTPDAFVGLTEEYLRDHFLMVLNANFSGAATGESFNVGGKTDILIHAEGRNVFIAECKFWKGPESLRDTIDQLLSYLSWRDTKTAIILFNRRAKDFSSILAKIPEAVAAHPNHLRRDAYALAGGFRFRFRQKNDPAREMLLTVLVFDVPASDAPSNPRSGESSRRERGRERIARGGRGRQRP